ncbi:hypothetical protein NDU88_000079 [Pleurodeles waltl]|uniref:Uncharacterized protein n=1 Tax=Pleurodeles waltl TaxID=8319 RepID=A0AAV7U4E3_PLEWA|nr:hypothetical protein NDU88_000079 [Pleurodeles waltl]
MERAIHRLLLDVLTVATCEEVWRQPVCYFLESITADLGLASSVKYGKPGTNTEEELGDSRVLLHLLVLAPDKAETAGVDIDSAAVVASFSGVDSDSAAVVASFLGVDIDSAAVVASFLGVDIDSAAVVASFLGVDSDSAAVVASFLGVDIDSAAVVASFLGVDIDSAAVVASFLGVDIELVATVVSVRSRPSLLLWWPLWLE